jgi:segregation and condensation protein B
MTNLSNQIEALLFWKSEPVSLKELSKMLSVEVEKIDEALLELEKNLGNRGIVLVKKDESVYLATSSESSELIKKITKEEESAELGKASLETLSIVLYKSPILRSDIDYIRGVNSSFILRNLLVRGLIDKKTDPKDALIDFDVDYKDKDSIRSIVWVWWESGTSGTPGAYKTKLSTSTTTPTDDGFWAMKEVTTGTSSNTIYYNFDGSEIQNKSGVKVDEI